MKEVLYEALGNKPLYSQAEVAKFLHKSRNSIPQLFKMVKDGKRLKVTQSSLLKFIGG